MSDLNVEPTISLVPGKECPTCSRRFPYPKKESSPDSRVRSYRVPIGEDDDYADVIEAAAKHIGTFGSPFWQYRLFLRGCADLLAGPSAEEEAMET